MSFFTGHHGHSGIHEIHHSTFHTTLVHVHLPGGVVDMVLEVWWTWSWRCGGHGPGGVVDMVLEVWWTWSWRCGGHGGDQQELTEILILSFFHSILSLVSKDVHQ